MPQSVTVLHMQFVQLSSSFVTAQAAMLQNVQLSDSNLTEEDLL